MHYFHNKRNYLKTKMTEFECLSSHKQLQVALYSDVIKICQETLSNIGLEIGQRAMMIIGDLVYKKLSMYGKDLEAFAKHAKREHINTDDVMLLVRKNPSLKALLRSKCSNRPVAVEKRRTTSNLPNSKKRKIEKPNNLPSTSRGASPIL